MGKRVTALAILILALATAAALVPATAFAASTIITPTTAENAAYNRCVTAAFAYEKHPKNIAVDISDLNLTDSQVIDVETRLHSNSELWWINTFRLSLSRSTITMPCKYDDDVITEMRKKYDAALKNAMNWIGPGMASSQQVHLLHDYVIKNVSYEAGYKNSYEALVNKRGDCFGYALAMDALLRRAGFETDVAFNDNADHSWNLVRIGSDWYHVDTTWDRWYTTKRTSGIIDHRFMLMSDSAMARDDHNGWLAHHKCKNTKFEFETMAGGSFSKHCNDYKNVLRYFWSNGVKYKITGVGKVSVDGANMKTRSKKSLLIPETVTFRKVKYTVTGIKAKALSNAATQTLYVRSTKLVKANVKNALLGSKVRTVRVPNKKITLYGRYFAKSHSGKSVRVQGATYKVLLRAA